MKKLLFLVFLFSSLVMKAQDPSFVVYYAKGKVTKAGKGAPLQKGGRLQASDVLRLTENAEIVLVCSNYNTVQLKGKGDYPVQQLLARCNSAESSFTSSYFRYIWDELTHAHGAPEKDPKNYMRNKGAVSRGCVMVQTSLPVDSVHYVAGALLPIYWKTAHKQPHISIYDDAYEGRLLVKDALGKDPIQLSQVLPKLEGEGAYFWQITNVDGTSCGRNYLRVWNPEEYKAAVADLSRSVVPATPAETAYMKGFLLEENHFLAEAFKYYQEAAKLDANNTVYRKTLQRFHE